MLFALTNPSGSFCVDFPNVEIRFWRQQWHLRVSVVLYLLLFTLKLDFLNIRGIAEEAIACNECALKTNSALLST